MGLKDMKVEQKYKSPVVNTKPVEPHPPKKEAPSYVTLMNDENSLFVNKPKETQKYREPTDVVVKYNNENQKENENSFTIYSPPEQTEESTKAFMDSISSWLNDLFTASNKATYTEVKPEKVETQKEVTLEDVEYTKFLTAVKKRYQKKLKNETSVHLTASGKPFEFNFERDLKSMKRKAKVDFPSQNFEEMQSTGDDFFETLQFIEQQDDSGSFGQGTFLRSKKDYEDFFTFENTKGINSFLPKNKKKLKRAEGNDFKNDFLQTATDPSKRMLLDLNEQDVGLHLLKNPHLGMQESQHYGQRKKRAYQVNARCYTTKANPKENVEVSFSKSGHKWSQYCSLRSPKMRGIEDLNKNPSEIKKYLAHRAIDPSDMSKNPVTFTKTKSKKYSTSTQVETQKNDSKTPSDELMKYLMKKMKTSTSSTQIRKKSSSQALDFASSPRQKGKIKRLAATNNFVTPNGTNNVPVPVKTVTENKYLPVKDLRLKYPENLRFDVSRAVSSGKFNKCSYISDNEKVEEDRLLLEKNAYKNARRFTDIFSKRYEKKSSEKQKKEYLKKSSKMDFIPSVFQKPKQNEINKDLLQDEFQNPEEFNISVSQMARYKRQHDLFRTNSKQQELPTDLEINPLEAKIQNQEDSSDMNLLPAQFDESQTTLQLAAEEKNKIMKPITVSFPPEQPEPEPVDLAIEKKPLHLEVEKKTPEKPFFTKNKSFRNKSLHILKEDTNVSYDNLEEFSNNENKNQIDPPKISQSSMNPTDFRVSKSILETSAFNRKNSMRNASPKTKTPLLDVQPNVYLLETGENMINKDTKDKREKTPPKSEMQDYKRFQNRFK